MPSVVLERTFDPPLTEEEFARISNRLAPCLEQHGIRWIESHLSLDRRRLICRFAAADAEGVRSALRRARLHYERVWTADLLLPNEADTPLPPAP